MNIIKENEGEKEILEKEIEKKREELKEVRSEFEFSLKEKQEELDRKSL